VVEFFHVSRVSFVSSADRVEPIAAGKLRRFVLSVPYALTGDHRKQGQDHDLQIKSE
jgi:hypothetical protein